VTFSHGAQFGRASFEGGIIYRPLNAAALGLAPDGLDANCNPRP
jgi:hypothetical protein